jgi:hypothetical protein
MGLIYRSSTKKGNLVLSVARQKYNEAVELENKMKHLGRGHLRITDKIHQRETRFGLGNIIY